MGSTSTDYSMSKARQNYNSILRVIPHYDFVEILHVTWYYPCADLRKFHGVQCYTSPVNAGQMCEARNALLWLRRSTFKVIQSTSHLL